MKEFFEAWSPSKEARELIVDINEIMEDYAGMGYMLTLRQLYYQLVSKDIIPNSQQSYNRIGNIVSKGRLAGLIDWNQIEDRVRVPKSRGHWDSPAEMLESAANAYYRDHWETQDHYIEVWCEKDAMSSIIEPVCSRLDVIFMANRGYSSSSAMYAAAKRIQENGFDRDKHVKIIYLGDHDPSGIDMTRDIEDRLGLFLYGEGKFPFVSRIALNMEQVEEFQPPRNPAKLSDSRASGYIEEYGSSSWELDALSPEVINSIITSEISQHIDQDAWDEVEKIQNDHESRLRMFAKQFDDE